ncbi:hypothetical protein PFISCL1PPCAC_12850, partial [Pristionchus fissidentatus]
LLFQLFHVTVVCIGHLISVVFYLLVIIALRRQAKEQLCRLISDQFCGLAADFMHVVMSHSTAIVAVCFWYRTRILTEKGAIGAWSLQALLAAVFAPHALHIAGFSYTINSREDLVDIVEEVYERGYSSVYALQEFGNCSLITKKVVQRWINGFPLSTHEICAALEVSNKYSTIIQRMMLRLTSTYYAEKVHVQVLTIHAIIPVGMVFCISTLVVAQVFVNQHSADIEGLAYDISAIPTVTNPILTLCFVRPYR